jgi:hypothetical protein
MQTILIATRCKSALVSISARRLRRLVSMSANILANVAMP